MSHPALVRNFQIEYERWRGTMDIVYNCEIGDECYKCSICKHYLPFTNFNISKRGKISKTCSLCLLAARERYKATKRYNIKTY